MNEDRYVQALLDAYRTLPGTTGRVRPADRPLARQLFHDRIPIELVRTAFRVALSRRRTRPADLPPLPTIRSLHYFLPVIEEARSTTSTGDPPNRNTTAKMAANCANSQRCAVSHSRRHPSPASTLPRPPG